MSEPDPIKPESGDKGCQVFSTAPDVAVAGENNGDSILARLETAAEAGDGISFLNLLEELDYETLSSDDFIRVMKAALRVGAYPAARALSVEASNRYPTDAEIQKYAYVLAPPRVISSTPADPIVAEAIKNDWNWLRANGAAYRGKWVALRNGEFLGAADSLKDLTKDLDDRKNVFLTIAY
jgi:hypothetical protein